MTNHYDVVIWDATPAGLLAAVAAASMGSHVLVLTDDKHIGGLQTSGLGWTNAGQRETVGGLAREFFNRVNAHYTLKYGKASPQVVACENGFLFEPHVAELIYEDWLTQAGVEVVREVWIDHVKHTGSRIDSVKLNNGESVSGRVWIDASYEGDLLAKAGCSYAQGRESRDEYGESLAGVRWPESKRGQADRALQPMDHRLCLTNVASNRVPFRKPDDYQPSRYAYHAAMLQQNPPAQLNSAVVPLNPMPNGKTDSRCLEWAGAGWDWPDLSPEHRKQHDLAQRNYTEGYLWFMLNSSTLSQPLRDELATWGYARDEFTDNDNWPYHIYVREARRLVGDKVMTQRDVGFDRYKDDGVALGCFYLDVHPVQRLPDPTLPQGERPEGTLGFWAIHPYEIPYSALLPKRSEITNLLVPICLSASHVAFSTIRMEPVYMMLGQAAGVASAMAAADDVDVQDVSPQTLRDTLGKSGALFDAHAFPNPWPENVPLGDDGS